MSKRVLSLLLALLMVLGTCDQALAAGLDNGRYENDNVIELPENPEPTEKPDEPEVTPEPTPEITPEPTPEITPEPTPEITPEPTPEITPEPTPEITPEPTEKPVVEVKEAVDTAYSDKSEGEYTVAVAEGSYSSDEDVPVLKSVSVTPVEGRTVLEGWTISGKGKDLKLTVSIKAMPTLEEGETLALVALNGSAQSSQLKAVTGNGDFASVAVSDSTTGIGLVKVATPAADETPAEKTIETENQTKSAGNVSINGFLPVGGSVTAVKQGASKPQVAFKSVNRAASTQSTTSAPASNETVLASYDITILDENGESWQPEKAVTVTIKDDSFGDGKTLQIYHQGSNGREFVATVTSHNNTVSFSAEHFSVYVVTQSGDDARLKVNFVQADGNTKSMMINKRQLDKVNQYIFDPGAGTLPDGTMFNGWTTVENYTASTTSKTIADVRTDVTNKLNEGIADGTELTYYAMVFKPYSINYRDERGKVITTEVVLVRNDDATSPTHTVTRDYTPYPPEEDGVSATFKGWQQLQPEVAGTEVLYQVNESFTLTESTYVLQAKVEQGHWLSFDENLTNASYTEPVFVPTGSNPTRPANPTRAGYTFNGWYTEDASSDRDGQVAGSEFNFNASLSANTTVYAKWTKDTRAPYTVIIWKQNVTGDGYDFGESVTIPNGTVGSTINTVVQNGSNVNTGTTPAQTQNVRVNGTEKAYTGFHCARFDQNVTIKEDGTTVLNVYYDRNRITINFDAGNNRYILDEKDNTYKRRVTYTGLFEAPLSFTWPTTYYTNDSGGGANNTLWQYGGGTTLSFIGSFKLPNPASVSIDMTRDDTGTHPRRFILQNVDGSWPTSAHDTIYMEGTSFTITDKYTGFYAYQYRRHTSSSTSTTGFGSWTNLGTPDSSGDYTTVSNAYQLEIRFARIQKPITYLDGVYVDAAGAPTEQTSRGQLGQTAVMYYGADVSSYGKGGANYFKPSDGYWNGYVFLGWFADETCTTPYTFTTMPPDGVTVYAKWQTAQYEVNLNANDSTDDPIKYNSATQATQFYVDDGEKNGNVGGERIYFDLVGWYTDEGLTHPYSFDAYRINKQTVGTYGKLYSDSEINPDWPNTIGQLDLYAKWRSKLIGADGIDVVYNPVYEVDDSTTINGSCGTDGNKYADDSDAVAIGAAVSDNGDYVFSHWEVQKWNGTAFVLDKAVFPGDLFNVLVANAKIVDAEGHVVTKPEKGNTYTYTIQVNAVYVEKDKEILTHINWYDNYTGATVAKNENLRINEAVDVPAAPTREGYEFKGWIRGIEEDGTTTTLTDLFITYENGAYNHTQVAADEHLVGDGTQHHAMYAKWEAIDVDYTVEFYYQNADGTYAKDDTLTATRQAKTDSTVEVTTADKTPKETPKYVLDESKNEAWSATVAGDGSTVLKVYFKLNQATVTVHHYLKGTTTKVADDVTENVTIGTEYTATPVTTYQEKNLTVDSYNPSQPVTVSVDGNEITIYYTLPLTITAETKSQTYNGSKLKGSFSYDGALDSDKTTIEGAFGEPLEIGPNVTAATSYQAGTTGIPGYYTITNTPGTLEITPNTDAVTVTIVGNHDSKVYTGEKQSVEGYTYSAKAGETTIANSEFTVALKEGKEAKAEGTDVDTYEMGLTKDDFTVTSQNYSNITVEYTDGYLEITPITDAVTVTIVGNHDSKVYTGEKQSVEGYTYSAKAGEATIANDEFSVALKEGKEAKAEGTDVDTYEMGLTKDDFTVTSQNYSNITVEYTDGYLEITPTSDVFTISLDDDEYKYDGSAHANANSATSTAKTGTTTYSYSFEENGTYVADLSSLTKVDAGEYTIYVKGTNPNYTATATTTAKLTITKRAVTLTSESGEKPYDGTALTKPEVTVSGDGFVEGEATDIKATGSVTTVAEGEVTNTITYTEGANFKADNYTITKNEGKLKITQREVTVSVADKTVPYNGSEQQGNTETTFTNVVDGQTATIGYTASKGTLVNTYDNGAYADDFKVVDGDGKDVTGNYTLGTPTKGKLIITDEDVPDDKVVTKTDGEENDGKKYHIGDTVEWTVWVKNIYDEEKTLVVEEAEGMTITSEVPEKLAAGKEIEITVTHVVTAADVAAGSIKNEVKVKLGDLEKTGDDTVETEKIKITVTAASQTKQYDGTALTNGTFTVTPADSKVPVADGHTVRATVTGSQTQVGSSANTLSNVKVTNTVIEKDAEGKEVEVVTDVTAAYEITTVNGTLTVTTVPYTINYVFTWPGGAAPAGAPTPPAAATVNRGANYTVSTATYADIPYGIAPNGNVITVLRFQGWDTTGTINNVRSNRTITGAWTIQMVWYTVTYTDGVPGEVVFPDQVTTTLRIGANTPAFNGTPTREGFNFTGWAPAVSPTVTGNNVYTAQWAPIEEEQIVEPTPEPTPVVEEEITDEEVPQAAPAAAWALINLLAALGTVATAVGMIITFFKKKDDDDDGTKANPDEESDENKGKKSKFLGLIPAVASVIIFILTENMHNPMTLVDKWTIPMVLILAANGIVAYLTRNKKPEDEDTEKAAG